MTVPALPALRRALSAWDESTASAASAGLAAFLFYGFAMLPLQVAVAADLGLSDEQASASSASSAWCRSSGARHGAAGP